MLLFVLSSISLKYIHFIELVTKYHITCSTSCKETEDHKINSGRYQAAAYSSNICQGSEKMIKSSRYVWSDVAYRTSEYFQN